MRRPIVKAALDIVGLSCVCCGQDEIGFLTLDHIDNDGAEHREEVGDVYAWTVAHPLEAKLILQTACADCNMGRSWNGGICPHAGRWVGPDAVDVPRTVAIALRRRLAKNRQVSDEASMVRLFGEVAHGRQFSHDVLAEAVGIVVVDGGQWWRIDGTSPVTITHAEAVALALAAAREKQPQGDSAWFGHITRMKAGLPTSEIIP